jgi:hypothetical protein
MAKLPSLRERVEALRVDVDNYVDARVAEIKKDCPGLPDGTIRNTLVRGNCHCASFLDLEKANT